ncbi:MAG: hypothetical protein U9P07_02790, partial [Pseudomonadota bacterium]|nr:hypothetical protein [Pseudomonadota bacterium]
FSPAVHGLPVRAARRQAGFRGVRRESHRVIRSAANTACLSADKAMSQARTSCNVSLALQVRKLRSTIKVL